SEVTDPFVADFRTLTADYDGDLDVDLDDHGVFVSTFGSTIDLRADGNNDGVVNAIDYTIWRDSEELVLEANAVPAIAFAGAANFGGTSIPEPASGLLALGLAAAGLSSRRSR
ncbi:MAG: PEP-CTERM sorting domain-containing protein, partial [Planctomycetota bacterium]